MKTPCERRDLQVVVGGGGPVHEQPLDARRTRFTIVVRMTPGLRSTRRPRAVDLGGDGDLLAGAGGEGRGRSIGDVPGVGRGTLGELESVGGGRTVPQGRDGPRDGAPRGRSSPIAAQRAASSAVSKRSGLSIRKSFSVLPKVMRLCWPDWRKYPSACRS